MKDTVPGLQRFRGIAFLGNYLPRKCGIATFTHDLAEAVSQQAGQEQPVIVCAMNDLDEGYAYPDRVKFEVRQDHVMDYARGADYLNFSRIDVVSLQHEYGIFGGEAGANLLMLLRDLKRPLAVTCHTVLKEPIPEQKEVFTEIAERASMMVVMSERAFSIMEEVYSIDHEKIRLIPHGVHDMPFIDPAYYKDKFGVEGRRVLLTFGLLHRNKGIEHMIEALPTVVDRHPNTTYLVLGATHPAVLREEGESYRLELQRRARDLGVEEHVLFHPRFVELDELLEYLGAADIFVTPYLLMDQITSGVLSYAMGAGKAVVSTPYWHAQELLAEGRGRLVPPGDPDALAQEILDLLDHEVTLAAMRKKAYLYCRNAVWSSVARQYLDLFDEIRLRGPAAVPVATAMRRPLAASNLPTPQLDHLIRLSDDTGLAHHACRTVADWTFGYQTEDAAVGLVVTTKFHDLFKTEEASRLAERCLTLLQYLIREGQAEIPQRLTYARVPEGHLDDTGLGKLIWALGYATSHGPQLIRAPANDLFNQIVPDRAPGSARGAAYAILGAADYLRRFPGASAIRRYLEGQTQLLGEYCAQDEWFDKWEDPDWPVAVQALSVAAGLSREQETAQQALMVTEKMRGLCAQGTMFPIRGTNPEEEENPVMAAVFIEALGAVLEMQTELGQESPPDTVSAIRSAVDWFLGANRLEESLYDFTSGGCHDALTAGGLNENQGAEATLHCLLSFLTVNELALWGQGTVTQ
jgi:glycosyltransferase involved in cell wall biosynthesis